jgi:hypothetical protein
LSPFVTTERNFDHLLVLRNASTSDGLD